MASYDYGKDAVIQYIMSLEPQSILDVGACDGKWAQLLRGAGYQGRLDACEIWRPNAAKILDLYDNTFVGDIVDYTYGHYDVVIFGDVLEHMDEMRARWALGHADLWADEIIIGVPYQYRQGELYGNPYERHIQDDLTPEIFRERYGDGFELFIQPVAGYGYYRRRKIKWEAEVLR